MFHLWKISMSLLRINHASFIKDPNKNNLDELKGESF